MKGSEYGYVEKKDVSGFKVFIKFPKLMKKSFDRR